MRQLGAARSFRLPAGKGQEQLAKVRGLPVIHHIDDLMRRPGFNPVVHRREIRSHVVEAAIALLDDGGRISGQRIVLDSDL